MKSSRLPSYFVLACAALALPFSNGRFALAPAAWLGPALLAAFVKSAGTGGRRRAAWVTLTPAYLVFLSSSLLQWWDAWNASGAPGGFFLWAGIAAAAVLGFLPYGVDLALSPKVPRAFSTLVFPVTWVSAEFVFSGMFANVGSIAYTQVGTLPLLQLASVTGTFGISFLLAWFASVSAHAWTHGADTARRDALAFCAVLFAVYAGGQARLAFFPPAPSTFRVASITADATEAASRMKRFIEAGGHLDESEMKLAAHETQALNDRLFERTRREARAGAKLVLWSEANGHILKQEEWAFFKKAQELTRREGIYLFAGVATFLTGKPKAENKVIAFGPHGETLFEYFGKLSLVETPFGSLSAAIGTDLDRHRFVRQAGLLGVDTLLDSSAEWEGIDPNHTWIAIFRAVENGFNLLKQTQGGMSVAVDYQGRVLSRTDFYRVSEKTLVAQLPTGGTSTIYSRVGDLFAWACLMALAALGFSAKPPRRSRR